MQKDEDGDVPVSSLGLQKPCSFLFFSWNPATAMRASFLKDEKPLLAVDIQSSLQPANVQTVREPRQDGSAAYLTQSWPYTSE